MIKLNFQSFVLLSVIIFLTACGEPPSIQPPGGIELPTETSILSSTTETTAMLGPTAITKVEPTSILTETVMVEPVTTLDNSSLVEYSADKIQLTPAELELNTGTLSIQSDNSEILFNSWSNSGQKFTFIKPLPKELIDSNPPEGMSNTFRAAELWIANVNGTDARKVTEQMGDIALWSPDDSQIAYFKLIGVINRELWIIDLKTNTQIKLDEPASVDIGNINYYGSIGWLDNHRLLYGTYSKTGERNLWLHDVPKGQIVAIKVDDKLDNAWSSFWLAPNKVSIVGNTLKDLWLGQLVGENGEFRLNYVKSLIAEDSLIPYWSPDSTKLAIVSFGLLQNKLRVLDINSGNVVEIPFELTVMGVEWSPDSEVLIVSNNVTGSGPKTYPIYVVNVDGSNLRLLSNSANTFIKWSPDGQHLLLKKPEVSNTIDIYKVEVK